MVAASWMDSRVVNFLATGCSTKSVTVQRKRKGDGVMLDVTCPELVRTYNNGMEGGDQHDQLRLHCYSIQKALCHRSYYKNLFFGIVDMSLINGFIVHRLVMKEKVPTHAEYMTRLHARLLEQQKVGFEGNMQAQNLLSTPATELSHVLSITTDTYHENKAR
ncbi:hypothetical protein PI124_g16574 [Phytophthora idaei]|nr:hypothetical protein PI125_g19674 [Phytophthora idaei]KAG3127423.1 hypothetical protein PI126_g21857 [Phytophthora idaei]KAG3238461.1 hypothetical protein PI124_g16574 [Phytophthora idaei]